LAQEKRGATKKRSFEYNFISGVICIQHESKKLFMKNKNRICLQNINTDFRCDIALSGPV
jgi:hypothetical protein